MPGLTTLFLLLAASLFGVTLLQRALRESLSGLCLSLGPLQGLAVLVLLADLFPHVEKVRFGYLLGGLSLLLLFVRRPRNEEYPPLPWRPWGIVITASTLVVLGYTHYAQTRFLDSDNWVHEPQIAAYMRGIFPPERPFLHNTPMHGHYGRDLLVASLSQPLQDPLGTAWLLNLVTQGCGFAGLFFLGLRYRQGLLPSYLLAMMVYFGICVGSRTGMADCFDGNNGLVYSLLILLFYHLGRVLEWHGKGGPAAWLVAGVTLGIFQLIYETHFGLLFLTGLTLALLLTRKLRPWLGLLLVAAIALSLAFTEGGSLTDMAHNRTQALTQTDQNRAQHVSMQFPKQELFKVLVTTADYQRVSVAFKTRLFAPFKPRLAGEGYMAIYDPRFLYAHWLPLFLCPFSLLILWRHRNPLGLAFWFFGFWAYVAPALVDFGPLYELEYFRWEVAAGWGWAAALGIVLGEGLARPSQLNFSRGGLTWGPRTLRWLLTLLALAVALAPGERLLNDAVLDAQSNPSRAFQSPSQWRLGEKELGLTPGDLQAMEWMSPQVIAREQVISNLGSETAPGLWPDSVLGTLTGAEIAGHELPPESQRGHAHPYYDRNALWRAFMATGRVDMLQAAGIRWLFLDLKKLAPRVLQQIEKSVPEANRSNIFGDRRVYILDPIPAPTPRPRLVGKVALELPTPANELRRRTRYPLHVQLSHPVRDRWMGVDVMDASGKSVQGAPIQILVTGEQFEHSLVTPLEEGDYTLQLLDGASKVAELPFHVNLIARLGKLQARLDLPDTFESKRFSSLRVGLTSPVDIAAGDEFTLAWRLHSPGGDYLWEVDAIPQNVELNLKAGVEKIVNLQFLSPSHPGKYQPQLVLREKSSGEVIPLSGDFGPVRVP